MSTPRIKSKLKVGLSRTSGSIHKGPTFFTPPYAVEPGTSSASTTTPVVSTKTSLRTKALQKRKLEFAAIDHIKQEKESKQDKVSDPPENYDDLKLEDLKALIAQKKNQLGIHERHQKEKLELLALIEKWKQAGIDGLEMLRKIIVPTPTIEELLDSFKMRHDEFD